MQNRNILSWIEQRALKPVKNLAGRITFSFGRLISAVSLLLAFYLIFTAVSALLKLFGKDLLNQKLDKSAATYWIKRKEGIFTKKYYERMG